jgi:NitT/TauT family transport system substrate-binding protein
MESTVASRRDEMARFVRATMMGWRDFMLHPEPGLRMIQEMNPQADDGWMAYSVAKQRELRVVTGGDAETMGIGTMTEARWGQLATFMTDVKLIKPTTDWRAAFTTEFVRDLKI